MTPIPVSITMLVKNAERHLEACLAALAVFDEIIVLDNGSTDRTLDIARRFPNVAVHHHDFIGFGPMKNLAAGLARNDWVLNIDRDEILPPAQVAAERWTGATAAKSTPCRALTTIAAAPSKAAAGIRIG